MEYLIQYGLFLAKVVTIVVALVFVLLVLVSVSARQKRDDRHGHIKISKLNDQLDDMLHEVQRAVLDKTAYKAEMKKRKQRHKLEQQGQKNQAETRQDAPARQKKRIYILDFKGDTAASAVESLREEITAVLSMATTADEVILRLESPGGMVHAYGLASSQLMRIKDRKIPLVICVDKVAASGGYMMACLADRLIAAPFAIIGSIGVLVQMPNFHRILKRHDIDYETITAGEFKTTLSTFGEITQKGRDKVKDDIEDVHQIFKKWVKEHRPSVDIDKIATGETWLGTQAKDRYMVDEIRTSDEVIVRASGEADVFAVSYELRQTLQSRLSQIFKGATSSVIEEFSERSNSGKFYS